MEVKEFLKKREEEFKENFRRYGDDCKSLNMRVINQYAGFISLVENMPIEGSSVLDIGCGLGDINHLFKLMDIKDYTYLGIDLVEEFIKVGTQKYGNASIKFDKSNFIEESFNTSFDYILGNQLFYRKVDKEHTFEYVKSVMLKAFKLCNKGIMFNFLSTSATVRYEENYYVNPVELLDFAYSMSHNVILRNDYSPFEFTIIIRKNEEIHIRPTYYLEFAETYKSLLSKVYPELQEELKEKKNSKK